MLLAPLSLPPAVAPARSAPGVASSPGFAPSRRRAARIVTSPAPAAAVAPPGSDAARRRSLLLWALAGLLVVMLVPAARPGPLLGWSLPFWLVLAPLLNLAWLTRRQWPVALRAHVRRAAARRRPGARRLPARRMPAQGALRSRRARSAAVSADRSSNS